MKGWVAAMVSVAALVTGEACGGAFQESRMTVEVASSALRRVDNVDVLYTEAALANLEESPSYEDYQRSMRKWNALVTAARVAKNALETAESVIDMADEMDNEDQAADKVTAVLKCLGYAIGSLLAALEAVHIKAPELIQQALVLIGDYSGGCGDV